MSKAILVTGGGGYIGSHTCKELKKQGYLPVTIDNWSTGFRHNIKWGPCVEGNISNSLLIAQQIHSHQIETVIHFAGSAYVGESVQNPQKYYKNNTVETLSLLNTLLESGVKNIVFSSTCAVYGTPQNVPISESHPLNPISPYGESKLFIEKILQAYQKAYGLRFVCLRYFNAAGADPDGEIGEEHCPETHLIPLTMQACIPKAPALSIYGNDYPTPDGSAIRDYIHVCDLARAHVNAIQYLEENYESQVINLGTGTGKSVIEVVRYVEEVSQMKCNYQFEPRRKGDPSVLVAEPQKALKLLNWKPEYPNLKEIVTTSWNWYVHNVMRQTESKFQ
jgi:UDP-arabinose 4-epimerase